MSSPKVPTLWPGETVVCIGTGPSLTQADVDLCRGRARVIAINDAFKLASWADVLYCCDGKFVNQYEGIRSFMGPKYSLTVNARRYPEWIRLAKRMDGGLSLDPSVLCTGGASNGNSGFQAINLAVHFGATRILLLGYDMSRHGGKSHWFGEHPKGWLPSNYPAFVASFQSLVKPLARLGVEVINCSRVTALKTFPRMTIDEALPLPNLPVRTMSTSLAVSA